MDTSTTKLGCGALLLSTRIDSTMVSEEYRLQIPHKPSILLFQRGFGAPTYQGFLGGTGGIFELGKDKNPGDATARESLEEGNLHFNPEEVPFYQGSMEDRDLMYFLGDWYPGEGGIMHPDDEAIGHVWLTGKQALGNDLSFQYKEAIEKLIQNNLL